jgi:hypothetical protein
MKIAKFAFASLAAAVVICALISVGMLIYQTVTDALTNDSVSVLGRRAKFNNNVRAHGLLTRDEEEHKGFAGIEAVARYLGIETPVPANIRKENRTNSDFRSELKRVFPDLEIRQYSNMKNSDFIELIYDEIDAGNAVIVFHSVEKHEKHSEESEEETRENESGENGGQEFEMRYSLVVDVNIRSDRMTLNDPHGYIIRYPLNEFIQSTRFENYEMPFYHKFAFTFRIYSKNTVYVIELPERTESAPAVGEDAEDAER